MAWKRIHNNHKGWNCVSFVSNSSGERAKAVEATIQPLLRHCPKTGHSFWLWDLLLIYEMVILREVLRWSSELLPILLSNRPCSKDTGRNLRCDWQNRKSMTKRLEHGGFFCLPLELFQFGISKTPRILLCRDLVKMFRLSIFCNKSGAKRAQNISEFHPSPCFEVTGARSPPVVCPQTRQPIEISRWMSFVIGYHKGFTT